MGDPSAILAINSLDRYISTNIRYTNTFRALWTTGQNLLTYSSGQTPIGGAVVVSNGIPDGTTITAYNTVNATLYGTWVNDSRTVYIFTGVPIKASTLTAGNELAGIITQMLPFPSANGYGINLNNYPAGNSYQEPQEAFFATWVIGNNFVTRVGGGFPHEGDAIYDNVGLFGLVTAVIGNRIEFNGITQASQFAPQEVFYEPPVPIDQFTGTVTISNNTTTTLAVPQVVTQTYGISTPNQPVSNALSASYNDTRPYSYNFSISSPGALIYGYINRIIVSQIQLQYNIPTVCKDKNDTFIIAIPGPVYVNITLPHGFYYADELASVMQTLITADPQLAYLGMTVTFVPRDGFVFTSTTSNIFYFPNPVNPTINVDDLYRAYRLLGMTIANAVPAVSQTSFDYPNFLYTPYIDIYSDVLTNYQNIKDTNTSIQKPKGLVARVYVSGTGQIQTTGSTSALGTAPFVMTSDLNTPKVIRWSPDVAVPSIDFQLLDQYGEFIPGAEQGHSTEFQMTLLCVEGRD
jgi:hypothetical protein